MLKGWKTIIVAVSVIILGVLQMPEFSGLVGGCILDASATQPETCVMPAWLISGLGALMLLLRFITTSSIFKSE